MIDLSVGEVSGFIAAGVFVVQLIWPLALPAILIAFLSEENSLVTWSVLGRSLNSSFWPAILRTDAAADTGVRRRISNTGWAQTAGLAIITVASIVTPLGLYESVELAKKQTQQPFGYIPDPSAFGYGTPPRADAPFTRFCGTGVACPGTSLNRTCTTKGLLEQCTTEYDSEIPESLRGLFRDGATKFGSSISSIFDIEWRTYKNQPNIVAAYHQLSLLILDENVKAHEGLIVDMQSGGVGFRNHTAPLPSFQYGSTWSEDILFIEPETQCVNLNITLDFKLPLDSTSAHFVEELVLTDRGGFSAFSRISPRFDASSNGQTDLSLKERAFKAAWLNNFWTLVYFNATDPDRTNISRLDVSAGATFPISSWLNNTNNTFRIGHDTIRSNTEFGEYLDLTSISSHNQSHANVNPFGVSKKDLSFITNTCVVSTVSSPSNLNSSVVGCALLYGAANRTDGRSSLVPDAGSPWSVPIYSCASAIKATIRTVTFQYNGTGFNALKITAMNPKIYQDNSSIPLWGVEDLQPITVANAQPLWGILGMANTTDIPTSPYNISTISQESLYLPGSLDQYALLLNGPQPISIRGQNLPGVSFYNQALASALGIARPGATGYQGYADYSGQSSLALYAKWQAMSRTPDGAAKILNLVWTDVAANAVVGTKGWGLRSAASVYPNALGKRAGGATDAQQALAPITIYERHIRYELPYAIPAFIVLAGITAVLVTVSTLAAMGRTGPRRMRRFLEATSAGRIMGTLLWPKKRPGPKTKEWIEAVGVRRVRISKEGISAEGESLVNEPEEERLSEHAEGGVDKVANSAENRHGESAVIEREDVER